MPIETPRWPAGAQAAACITVDVDAESLWLGMDERHAANVTRVSEAQFGIYRGLPRLLELFGRYDVPATFYVPGYVAEHHASALEPIVESGHEIAHHGYLHRRPDETSAALQREEIERGLQALEAALGVTPQGYRAPWWELTSTTFHLLVEHGFRYDSSCMADDRPYLQVVGDASLLELPVHWSLDDGTYYAWACGARAHPSPPGDFERVWAAELEAAKDERRLITLTLEPSIIGRSHRMAALERIVAGLAADPAVRLATHGSVAARLLSD